MTEIANGTSDKIDPSTDGQMKDITSVLVTAMPDHETFDREKMEYWGGNKKLLKAKIRHLLEDVPSEGVRGEILKHWEEFYREVLKVKVDFSDIDLPPQGSILRRNELIPVVAEITAQEILGLLKANFPIPFSVKGEFPHVPDRPVLGTHGPECGKIIGGMRRPPGHYGILHRGGRSPDLDMRIVFLDDWNSKVDQSDAAFVAWKGETSRPFPEEFMSPKEYLLFTSYEAWRRMHLYTLLWYDLNREENLRGTAFPVVLTDQYGTYMPTLGCEYSAGAFVLQQDRLWSNTQGAYGRRVRVLQSLRNA